MNRNDLHLLKKIITTFADVGEIFSNAQRYSRKMPNNTLQLPDMLPILIGKSEILGYENAKRVIT